MVESLTVAGLAVLVGGELRGEGSGVLVDVTHDSRAAGPGIMFVAIRGFAFDGHSFAKSAAGQGAPLLVERWLDIEAPQIRVADTRVALAAAAAAVHGNPAEAMKVVGVTGTNGKTTVTYMLESIVRSAGLIVGRIGTTGAAVDGVPLKIARTTPEASDLQRLLREMADRGVDVVALEVSSHALELDRVSQIHFAIAAFTNLSQDHLDFHETMDAYFEAKAKLFDGRADRAVIWIEDPRGADLATSAVGDVTTVGLSNAADVRGVDLEPGLTLSTVTIETEGLALPVEIRPGGDFNVENGLIAAAIALALGIQPENIKRGLAAVGAVPGRFESVESGQPFVVLVDYAHSPGGVESAVRAVRALSEGTIIAVVGAAGDRDVAKRPLMGAAAAAADIAVITSDNPRSEDPDSIVGEVVAGTVGLNAVVYVEPDREVAIAKALDLAGPGDAVLILGKGHEQGQELGDRMIPFDDREVAFRHLSARWAS